MVFRMIWLWFAWSTWVWLALCYIVCIFYWWVHIWVCCLCKICKWKILTIGLLEIQLSESITLSIELIVLTSNLFILRFRTLVITETLSFCAISWFLIISNSWELIGFKSVSLLLMVWLIVVLLVLVISLGVVRVWLLLWLLNWLVWLLYLDYRYFFHCYFCYYYNWFNLCLILY